MERPVWQSFEALASSTDIKSNAIIPPHGAHYTLFTCQWLLSYKHFKSNYYNSRGEGGTGVVECLSLPQTALLFCCHSDKEWIRLTLRISYSKWATTVLTSSQPLIKPHIVSATIIKAPKVMKVKGNRRATPGNLTSSPWQHFTLIYVLHLSPFFSSLSSICLVPSFFLFQHYFFFSLSQKA